MRLTPTPRQLAFLPLAVALNVASGVVANQLGLPVYLDTLGTLLAVALAGTRTGIAAGLLSQLVVALQAGAYMLAFAPIQVVIATAAGLAARHGGFRNTGWSLLSGVATGLAAGGLSAIISYRLFAGVTAGGVTAVTAALRALGLPLERAVLGGSVSTDILDKALVFALAGVVLRGLPERLAWRYPLARRAVGA